MEGALIKRLRAAANISAVAGVYNGAPAIDFDERKSNALTAFPAAIQSMISPGKIYSQSHVSKTQVSRIRWECFGVTSDDAFTLAQAIVAELELFATFDGYRFDRGFLKFERSFPPEDVAGQRIFRRLIDMDITATKVE